MKKFLTIIAVAVATIATALPAAAQQTAPAAAPQGTISWALTAQEMQAISACLGRIPGLRDWEARTGRKALRVKNPQPGNGLQRPAFRAHKRLPQQMRQAVEACGRGPERARAEKARADAGKAL